MSRITRSKDLEIINLTEEDLENRTLYITGYRKQELLPPYSLIKKEHAKKLSHMLIQQKHSKS